MRLKRHQRQLLGMCLLRLRFRSGLLLRRNAVVYYGPQRRTNEVIVPAARFAPQVGNTARIQTLQTGQNDRAVAYLAPPTFQFPLAHAKTAIRRRFISYRVLLRNRPSGCLAERLPTAVRQPLLALRAVFSQARPDTSFLRTYQDTYPTLRTRHRKPFTFRNFGMFLHSLLCIKHKPVSTFKYQLKKKMFSFIYPNAVRTAVMNRKKRITYYKLVFKTKQTLRKKKFYHPAAFNKASLRLARMLLANKTSSLGSFNELFNTSSSSTVRPDLLGTGLSQFLVTPTRFRDEIMYERNFAYRGVDRTFKISEVRIPRIRFKPGYQRL